LPDVQMVVQQSAAAEHASPRGLQAAAPQVPLLQTFEQQSGPVVQAAPEVAHAPPVTAHTWATVSHAPEQQPAPLAHIWPATPQEYIPSVTPRSGTPPGLVDSSQPS
jgi:hypothetical protein